VPDSDLGTDRRARLDAARLYLVCGAYPDGRERSQIGRPDLMRGAIAGGVDIV